jgi:hypothetical protein
MVLLRRAVTILAHEDGDISEKNEERVLRCEEIGSKANYGRAGALIMWAGSENRSAVNPVGPDRVQFGAEQGLFQSSKSGFAEESEELCVTRSVRVSAS